MDDERATITAYRGGPYLVRGRFTVLDEDGQPLTTERKTVALCRCGKSRLRPLCDGTHNLVPPERPPAIEPPGASDTSDGSPACHRSSR